jgi:phosphonopyruvate decarboxylase
MVSAQAFAEAVQRHGFTLWSGVPCSYLQPFINYIIAERSLRYVPACNEGDAVSIAAGVDLGGGRAIAIFQNSGLGNAVNPITSLAYTHRVPLLLIVTLRGEPGGPADEPQHKLMGSITTRLLDLMKIRWEYFPACDDDIETCFIRALSWMETERTPYCFIMRKDSVAPVPAPPHLEIRPVKAVRTSICATGQAKASRAEMLAAVQTALNDYDLVLATTGYTGRELYASADIPQQLSLVGAMGCASSVGLGLALQRPDLRVIVLDGDGAALMRMGALAAIGYQRPANLVHIVLDNRMYESTGGQSTISGSVDLAGIAADCGYRDTRVIADPDKILNFLKGETRGLTFIRALITPGVMPDLQRPKLQPPQATDRFRAYIRDIGRNRL